jgi:magnesium-transporting ATPase (P-type)
LKAGEGGHSHEEPDEEFPVLHKIERGNMTLIAIIGIKDIIRPEVPKAVKQC